ncbi:outer membrane protein assembly factor BamE [Zymomonas mobilis subsp. mobilis]|uniref:outer membrane protein assembly factor BamE n=1 Tax=Zymomonas mobilis TaxID=542 RepID=UPI0005A14467|nr:outer membrane protein assembly factor BamE [Zymomonas mobilis]GEB87930.1 outer membrane protein assembly factor BamE [Zymomonas mobilis subsp. mobilis]
MTINRLGKKGKAGILLMLAGLSVGCTRIRDHRGYMVDKAMVQSVSPGVDNRQSVEKTLGRPTLAGEFDPNVWYYISTDTKQLVFSLPKAYKQNVLAVHFDPRGNVSRVETMGLEYVSHIHPIRDQTVTLSTHRGFFAELFNNVAAVGGMAGMTPVGAGPGGTTP